MRVKPVPEPPSELGVVAAAQRAVPLVPGSEADCCSLLMDRLELAGRDAARTWLTFLRGIGFVRETERGFARTRRPVTTETLATGLETGVLGGRELHEALGHEPMGPHGAFDIIRPIVPRWERARDPGWEATWRDRSARLLDWLVLAGLAARADGGYVSA